MRNTPDGFHSLIGLKCPACWHNELILFDAHQANPEYIINYSHADDCKCTRCT